MEGISFEVVLYVHNVQWHLKKVLYSIQKLHRLGGVESVSFVVKSYVVYVSFSPYRSSFGDARFADGVTQVRTGSRTRREGGGGKRLVTV